MKKVRKTTLVAGATGVVGRNLARHLIDIRRWEAIAVSRRALGFSGDNTYLLFDLMDPVDCRAKLAGFPAITHAFFAAYVERRSLAKMVAPNLAMLDNLVEALEETAAHLEHVHVKPGTKWYCNRVGSFKTTAKESDPGHMPPDFYDGQQAFIADRQIGNAWSWSAEPPMAYSSLRPVIR